MYANKYNLLYALTLLILIFQTLGMYGFQRIVGKNNRDNGAYFHELFLRGRPGLSKGILRLNHRALLDPDNEPNLYLFPPMPQHLTGCDHSNVNIQGVVNNSVNKSHSFSFP